MNKLVILCVEDEEEVREAVLRDLWEFSPTFRIESAEDAEDAREVVRECAADGDRFALILCDHILPGQTGVDFLVELNADASTSNMRKVLLTGQAGLEDTIKAVNEGNLDHYVAKPWTKAALHAIVRRQLTDFVVAESDDLLPYVSVLDAPRILEAVAMRQGDR